MDAVDGNAIGGLLIDVFGTEMTAASSTCATCGARRPVAELVVYRRSPGTVVRCRTCGSVLMVLVRRTDVIGVDLSGLASLSPPDRLLSRWAGIQDRPACITARG
jgi:DNA-directed RNA polymerase subunit RPC12/RpoP